MRGQENHVLRRHISVISVKIKFNLLSCAFQPRIEKTKQDIYATQIKCIHEHHHLLI